ncbi:MAG TPA: exonuclease domain-containing protein [Candidatus Tumulicola sp.]|nr:exonuclease domain-containing protein [Candidatus Tumulicola sp.]
MLARYDLEAAPRADLDKVDLWSCPFTVVDIETTGGVAGKDALTEIALVQVVEGQIARRWRSFVNPRQPIPPFITRLTGITDSMVAGAPQIARLLPSVVELIGDGILVGHNVRFDAAFLAHELRAHGYPDLLNPTVDTLTLARRTIAEVTNYKLGTLTRELGIDVERHHRALADATATAELLVHCIKRLEDCGVFTYGALREYMRVRALPRRRRPCRDSSAAGNQPLQMPVWTAILMDELSAVPSKPGVYLLKDAGDNVVYVGKSGNLRQRLRAYASGGKPAGAKIRSLRGVVASFDVRVAGSEFEALLLEAALVRSHNPPFNERLRNFKEFAFIKLEAGPQGRVLATTRLAADGARYYGPYGSMEGARAAVSSLQDALGLRGIDAPDGSATALPPGRRQADIDEAVAFLEGDADDVLLSIARRRDEAAARLRLDVAGREEQRLERLRRLRARHANLQSATCLNVLVLAPSDDPSMEQSFLFCGGRLAAQALLPRRLPLRGEARRLLEHMLAQHYKPEEQSRSFARQEEIDQLFILASWYRERKGGLCYVDLPARGPAADEAFGWAGAILDGEPLKVAGEEPQNEGEQRDEPSGEDIEEGCSAVIL